MVLRRRLDLSRRRFGRKRKKEKKKRKKKGREKKGKEGRRRCVGGESVTRSTVCVTLGRVGDSDSINDGD